MGIVVDDQGRFGGSKNTTRRVVGNANQMSVKENSPFSSVPWRQEWSESRRGQLAKRVATIAADLEAVASRVGDWAPDDSPIQWPEVTEI